MKLSSFKRRLARIYEKFEDIKDFKGDVPGQLHLPGIDRSDEIAALTYLKRLADLEEQFWDTYYDEVERRDVTDLNDDKIEEGVELRFDEEVESYMDLFVDDKERYIKVYDYMGEDQQADLYAEYMKESFEGREEELPNDLSDDNLDTAIKEAIMNDPSGDVARKLFKLIIDSWEVEDIIRVIDEHESGEFRFRHRMRLRRKVAPRKPIQRVPGLDEKNKKLFQNLVNKLRNRGSVKNKDLQFFFKKYTGPIVKPEEIEKPKEEPKKEELEEVTLDPTSVESLYLWFKRLNSKTEQWIVLGSLLDELGGYESELRELLAIALLEDVSIEDVITFAPDKVGDLDEMFGQWLVDGDRIPEDELKDFIKSNYKDDINNYLWESETEWIREAQPDELDTLQKGELDFQEIEDLNNYFQDGDRNEYFKIRDDWDEYLEPIVRQMNEIRGGVGMSAEVHDALEKYLEQAEE